MSDTPLWKQAFDQVEREVATRSEAAVRTDWFADMATQVMRATAPLARLAPAPPTTQGAATWVGEQIDKSLRRTRNMFKVVTGYDAPPLAASECDVVWERDRARLLRYRSSQRRHEVPVLLVMSLVSTAKVFDLRPHISFVGYLLKSGFDVYMLDWGVADERDANNGLATYVDDYLPGAAAAISEITGEPQIDVVGYCFGGVLAMLYAAAHPDEVRRLAVMAAPVDFRQMGPLVSMTEQGRLEPEELFDSTGNVPAATIKAGFQMLQPTAQVASYATLAQHLDNDAFVEQFRALTEWSNDHVPFPGACFAELTRALSRDNSMLEGTTPVGDRVVDLADLTAPFLCIVAERDHICPPDAATPVMDVVGSEHRKLVSIPAGHVGLMISRTSSKITLPAVIDWLTTDDFN